MCLRMGKKRIIAETGAGQHGVATVSFSCCYKIKRGSKERIVHHTLLSKTVTVFVNCPKMLNEVKQMVFVAIICEIMQATVCARFGLQCIIYMGAKV